MPTTVETSPYRPSGPAQHADPRPEVYDDHAVHVRRLESLAVLVAFLALYLLIGYRTTIVQHVIVFDALDRLSRAYLVWHNDPPKLAAVGFLFPPISTMVFLPLAAIKPVATSLVALPIASALFAALSVVVLNLLLARCAMPLPFRIPLLVAFGINPLWLFYAGNGMSEAVYVFFLVGGLYGFISWHTTRDARYLVIAGSAFALALLCRYGFVLWALLVAVLVGVGLVTVRRTRNEVEGSMVAYLAPIVYALTLWTLFNLLIVGRPFGWLTDSASGLAVNAAAAAPRDSGVGDVATRLIDLLVGVSPLALIALPLLIAVFVLQRNDMALWLGGFLALGIILIGARALISEDEGLLTLRSAMPVMVTAVIGAAWLFRSLEPVRVAVWAGAMVLMVLGMFLAWDRMKDYKFQNAEQAFTRALFSGADQEGASSIGGFNVGINPERRMAAYINRRIPASARNSILTDNAQTFGVILLTGRPQIFFDRIDRGDQTWRAVVRTPTGRLARQARVRYMLIASQSSSDLIRQAYRRQLQRGGRFSRVFSTDRYLLVRILPERARQATPFGAPPAAPIPQNAPPLTQPGAAGNAPATPDSPSRTGAPGGTP